GKIILESEKKRKKTKRRKRRKVSTSSSESDEWSDAEEEMRSTEGDGPFWTYSLQEMCAKTEFHHPEIFKLMSAKEFTMEYIRQSGLREPLLISDPPAMLGMKMPKSSKFSVQSVKKLIGGDRIIEVIEVKSQGSRQMSLDEFVKYYRGDIAKRARLLNVLSLEFSMSPLGEKVLSPALVRAVDWVELYWPKELRCVDQSSDDLTPFFPKVQHYCLMSVKECFTDFHIDFGGTSVWYHVLKGKKVFWMVEPTEHNLVLYEKWIVEGNNTVFFGDVVEKCARVELMEGYTFIIPSGWIHAVYTLEDSLVFGGNFLHSFSIPMQLRIRLSEDRIKVAKKFRYPFFNEMLWYVIDGVVNRATGRTFLKPIVSPMKRTQSESADELPAEVEANVEETDREVTLAVQETVKYLEDAIVAATCSGLQAESEEGAIMRDDIRKCDEGYGQHSGTSSEKRGRYQREVDVAKETTRCDQSELEARRLESNNEHKNEEKQVNGKRKSVPNSLEMIEGGTEMQSMGEEVSVDMREEESTAKESGERSVGVDEQEDAAEMELTFDDAYIVTLTEFEKIGYRELLTYMRKNMRFRSKMEPLNRITDPDRLLSFFEKVLDHEVDKEKLKLTESNDQPMEAITR
uniref:JmjC domain-containing protein n=3 Tax=Parascaris univalens TaxID=6257 RepID=A0A915ALU2_PARUN